MNLKTKFGWVSLIMGLLAIHNAIAGEVAIIGVDVIPMDQERVLSNQTVLIRDGRIAAIGERNDLKPSANAITIDGEGKYLLPGLADMHSHTAAYEYADEEKTPETRDDLHVRSELLLYLATGVTTLRNMVGAEDYFDIQRRLEAGEIPGPRMFAASPLVEGENAVWPDFATKITDPAEAEPLMAKFAADGYTMVKVYHTVTAEVFRALAEAAARHGLVLVGHVSFDVGIDLALEAQQYSIEHLRGYDFDGAPLEALEKDGGRSPERFGTWLKMTPERRQELAERTVTAGTWNCPTLVINEMLYDGEARAALLEHPDIRYVHPNTRAAIGSNMLDEIFSVESREMMKKAMPAQYKMILALQDAGAGLLTGTDTMLPFFLPGFTVIDEMEHFVEAGLTPFEALTASTSAAADSLHLLDSSGTVSVGKRADLLLLDANPLDDINNLWQQAGVVVNGKWMPRAKIIAQLEKLSASYPEPEPEQQQESP